MEKPAKSRKRATVTSENYLKASTLDEEWLGGPNEPIEDTLTGISLANLVCCDVNALKLYDVISRAAGEIRALRLHVKLYSKRIDDLEMELENALEPDDER
jgi:hypothetical protein